jgi:hypothetical protein
MPSRKSFLTTVSIAGSSLAASAAAIAPGVAAPVHAPSEAARTAALAMRRFDPKLTDHEIETIARGIDDGTSSAKVLAKPSLANGDEPVTRFVLPADPARA